MKKVTETSITKNKKVVFSFNEELDQQAQAAGRKQHQSWRRTANNKA